MLPLISCRPAIQMVVNELSLTRTASNNDSLLFCNQPPFSNHFSYLPAFMHIQHNISVLLLLSVRNCGAFQEQIRGAGCIEGTRGGGGGRAGAIGVKAQAFAYKVRMHARSMTIRNVLAETYRRGSADNRQPNGEMWRQACFRVMYVH